jgi:hypothetical protein
MQSFKEFLLKEEIINHELPTNAYIDISTGIFTSEVEQWITDGDGDDNPHITFEKWITSHLQDYFGHNEVEAFFGADEMLITYELDETNLHANHVREIRKKCTEIVDELLGTDIFHRDEDNTYISFREQLGPNVYTDWPYIEFYLDHSPSISLKDIHKKMPHCKKIIFYNAINKINSNVLGLLKLKELKHITIWPRSQKIPPWYEIVMKHFDADKNFIACQRELIEKDLDEYAEL